MQRVLLQPLVVTVDVGWTLLARLVMTREFSTSESINNIVFWDNGCGMDRGDFKAYGTFAYRCECGIRGVAAELFVRAPQLLRRVGD